MSKYVIEELEVHEACDNSKAIVLYGHFSGEDIVYLFIGVGFLVLWREGRCNQGKLKSVKITFVWHPPIITCLKNCTLVMSFCK